MGWEIVEGLFEKEETESSRICLVSSLGMGAESEEGLQQMLCFRAGVRLGDWT